MTELQQAPARTELPAQPSAAAAPDVLALGLAHHRAGNLAQASLCYAQILAQDLNHAEALHLLGIVARQQGSLAVSERLLAQAILVRPNHSIYHRNLAQTCELAGKLGLAQAHYRRAIALDPRSLKAIQRLAHLLGKDADLPELIALYQTLLALDPAAAEAHHELGRLYTRRRDRTLAVESHRRAVALEPTQRAFHTCLASALFALGELTAAAESYRAALQLDDQDPETHYSLAVVLQELGQVAPAAKAYRATLALHPNHAHSLNNLAALFVDRGDLIRGESFVRRSIEINPRNPNAFSNFANILTRQGKLVEAAEAFQAALALDPTHATVLANLGALHERSGAIDTAIGYYRRALDHHPDYPIARFNLATCQLALGDFANGWSGYESRWQRRDFRAIRPALAQAVWRGEALHGSSILIYCEQGLGDTLQFVRYLPMVAALGATIVVRVQPSLESFIRASFAALADSVQVLSSGIEDFPDFEWQSPLLSLPLAFGTTPDTIPAPIPYLHADPAKQAGWSHRLHPHALRLGLVWAGNPRHARDRQRSIPLDRFANILETPGIAAYSLQLGEAASQRTDPANTHLPLVDLSEHLTDFSATAAIVANLDLILTVDTAVAHLAGALGKPVWLLVAHAADWRWQRTRSTSPWYPTMRIFRQSTPDDWTAPLEEVEQALRQLLAPKQTQ